MYESPIEIIQGEVTTKFENDIYSAVQEYGIVVDKDELIKALQYDRNQYAKGYSDAEAKYTNCISYEDLKDIILNVECTQPESEFIKGLILGMCAKKIAEKR